MFCFASGDPFAPHAEAGRLHFAAHDGDDLFFLQACLGENGVERGFVIPRHFDDIADVRVGCVGHGLGGRVLTG